MDTFANGKEEATYAAFLSYSTDPDYRIARTVEAYLESFHNRAGIRPLKLTKLEICRDGSDFRIPKRSESDASEKGPIYRILDSYLSASKYLAVLCSRNARDSPYVKHEIDYFLGLGRADSILLLVTEGVDPASAPAEVFPAQIVNAGLHLDPWYDLRRMRPRRNAEAKRARAYEDELARLAAHLYGNSAGSIYPVWLRQRERNTRRIKVGAATGLCALAGAAGWWGWTFTDSYQYHRIVAEAPVHEVRNLDGFVQALAESGDYKRAIEIARGTTDPAARFDALHLIADALHEHKDIKWAGAIYIEALEASGSSNYRPILQFADCVAGAIVTSGFVSTVMKTLTTLNSNELGTVSKKLLEAGKSEEALRVARLIPDNFEGNQATALAEVAATLTPQEARAVLEEALRDSEVDDFLGRKAIMRSYLAIGDFDRAWQVANGITYDREFCFVELADWAAEHGDMKGARAALTESGNDSPTDFINGLADKGLMREAESLANDAKFDAKCRILSLVYLAKKAHASGDGAKAQKLLDAATRLSTEPTLEISTANTLAEALVQSGKTSEAHALIDKVTAVAKREKKWQLISELAETEAKLGWTGQALELAESIEESQPKQSAMNSVALAYAAANDAVSSLRLAHSLDQSGEMGNLCEKLLDLFVSQGKVAEALQTAQCINNDGRRSAMLMGAVKTLASSNKPLQARKILAAMPSDSEFDKQDRTSATISLAPVLARNEHLDIALQLANNLALEGRVRTLSKIVAALGRTQKAQRGQIVSTISGTSLVGDSFATDRIWGDVADDLTQAEELDAASLVARRINDTAKRSASFQDIAVAYARKNSLVAARRCLDEISEPRVRMAAIVDILKLRTEKAS